MHDHEMNIERIPKVLATEDPTPTPTPTDKCAGHCVNPDAGTVGHHDNRQPLY